MSSRKLVFFEGLRPCRKLCSFQQDCTVDNFIIIKLLLVAVRARDVEIAGCGSRCLGDGKADVGGWSPGALSSRAKSSSDLPTRVSWSMSGTYRSYSVGHLLVRGLEMGADPKVAQLGLPRQTTPAAAPNWWSGDWWLVGRF